MISSSLIKNLISAIIFYGLDSKTEKTREYGEENSKEEAVLGIIIDNKLTIYIHIKDLYRKISQMLSAFSRISSYLNSSKKT